MSDRPRIVLALPDLAESGQLAEWLAAEGFEPVRRANARAAADEMQARSCDLLIADATFALRDGLLTTCRGRVPQTPCVVIGSGALTEQQETRSRQSMFLARPVERAMLICTISMAILDGRPTRCSARKAVNRFDAIVNGVPSHVIDVSNEGLRLEMPRERQTVPPPYFAVRVPLIGVVVAVQRKWARAGGTGSARPVTLCGAALTQNRPQAEQAWRMFVDTIPLAHSGSSNVLHVR